MPSIIILVTMAVTLATVMDHRLIVEPVDCGD